MDYDVLVVDKVISFVRVLGGYLDDIWVVIHVVENFFLNGLLCLVVLLLLERIISNIWPIEVRKIIVLLLKMSCIIIIGIIVCISTVVVLVIAIVIKVWVCIIVKLEVV